MGTDWLEQHIKTIRASEQTRHRKNQVRLHRADILEANAPTFFAEGGKETKEAVDVLNHEFKDNQKRHLTVEIRPNTITVSGLGSKVTATLQPGGNVRFTTESGHVHVRTREHTIELGVDDDLVYCKQAESREADAISQVLLGPFLSAFREGA